MINKIINRIKSNKGVITLYNGDKLHVGDPDVIHHGTPLWDIDENEPATLNRVEQLDDNDNWDTVSFVAPGKTTLETWSREMTDADGNRRKLTLTIETENDNDNTDYVYSADWSDADCEIIEANADYVGHNVPGGHDVIDAVFDIGSGNHSRHVVELTVDDYVVAQNNDLSSWWDIDLQRALEASDNPLKTLGSHMRAILINSYDPADYDDDDPAKQLIADNAGWWHIRVDNRKIRL